ncbi:Protein of unknown function [Colwellia chukchiensis]|uniref:DUF3081 domain-containing protein n=1 Tax=Colwellia chukchiensis TaxID=641665 RepID=A0A1H7SXP4_9GAMM|nr:DUF3081 domain-containing protein [Colwellia chukchiensis]SEL76734.1 Protein of unknown function [Colwellia chukchiensis]
MPALISVLANGKNKAPIIELAASIVRTYLTLSAKMLWLKPGIFAAHSLLSEEAMNLNKSNALDLKDLLHIFNLVTREGEKIQESYHYEGIKAWHDFDGYTCFLAYKDLTLTFLFHGRYNVDFEQQATFDRFVAKVSKLLMAEK